MAAGSEACDWVRAGRGGGLHTTACAFIANKIPVHWDAAYERQDLRRLFIRQRIGCKRSSVQGFSYYKQATFAWVQCSDNTPLVTVASVTEGRETGQKCQVNIISIVTRHHIHRLLFSCGSATWAQVKRQSGGKMCQWCCIRCSEAQRRWVSAYGARS